MGGKKKASSASKTAKGTPSSRRGAKEDNPVSPVARADASPATALVEKAVKEAAQRAVVGDGALPPLTNWTAEDYPCGLAPIAEEDRREIGKGVPSTFPLAQWPVLEYRHGMVFYCPCGEAVPTNHFASCAP